MKAYYLENPRLVTEPARLICTGTERECRHAAAKALGRGTLRGCPSAPSDRGVIYYAPGYDYDDAPSVELV